MVVPAESEAGRLPLSPVFGELAAVPGEDLGVIQLARQRADGQREPRREALGSATDGDVVDHVLADHQTRVVGMRVELGKGDQDRCGADRSSLRLAAGRGAAGAKAA
jgi:hypothetical protein